MPTLVIVVASFKINLICGFYNFKMSFESFSANPEFMHCHQVYREVKDVGVPGYVKKQNRNSGHGHFRM